MEPQHCNSEHEILLYEVKDLHKKLDEISQANVANTAARNKAEGVLNILKYVGIGGLLVEIIRRYLF